MLGSELLGLVHSALTPMSCFSTRASSCATSREAIICARASASSNARASRRLRVSSTTVSRIAFAHLQLRVTTRVSDGI